MIMQENKLVSVIVPIYNAEKHLQECVESVLRQTYSKLEIILLDDGSEDISLQICETIANSDKRVQVYHHENRGVSATRNRGIDLAQGDYMVFVDADDIIEADMVESMLLVAKKNYLILGNSDMILENSMVSVHKKQCKEKTMTKKYFWHLYEKGLLNPPWGKLYESEIIKKNIRFKEDISLGEDLLFNLGYIKHVDGFIYLDETYYHYRQIDDSLSHKYRPDGFEIQVLLFNKLISFCQTEIELTVIEWIKLYWDFFKALQRSLDVEYEFNQFEISDSFLKRLYSQEMVDVFQKVYDNRRQYRLRSQWEIFLYKHNMWKFDYELRNLRRKYKRNVK